MTRNTNTATTSPHAKQVLIARPPAEPAPPAPALSRASPTAIGLRIPARRSSRANSMTSPAVDEFGVFEISA